MLKYNKRIILQNRLEIYRFSANAGVLACKG